MKKPDYAINMTALLLLTTVTALSSTPIKPSNTLVTKRVSGIGHFDEIVTTGIVNVEYSQSRDGKTTVWVCGNDNLVDLVEMSSEGGTLQISMKKCDFSGGNASLKRHSLVAIAKLGNNMRTRFHHHEKPAEWQ